MAKKVPATCPRCAGDPVAKHVATTKVPSASQLQEWDRDGGCESTDGCWTDPDSKCEHGHSSWLLRLGYV